MLTICILYVLSFNAYNTLICMDHLKETTVKFPRCYAS